MKARSHDRSVDNMLARNLVSKIVNMLNFNDSFTCRNNIDLSDRLLLDIFICDHRQMFSTGNNGNVKRYINNLSRIVNVIITRIQSSQQHHFQK